MKYRPSRPATDTFLEPFRSDFSTTRHESSNLSARPHDLSSQWSQCSLLGCDDLGHARIGWQKQLVLLLDAGRDEAAAQEMSALEEGGGRFRRRQGHQAVGSEAGSCSVTLPQRGLQVVSQVNHQSSFIKLEK